MSAAKNIANLADISGRVQHNYVQEQFFDVPDINIEKLGTTPFISRAGMTFLAKYQRYLAVLILESLRRFCGGFCAVSVQTSRTYWTESAPVTASVSLDSRSSS